MKDYVQARSLTAIKNKNLTHGGFITMPIHSNFPYRFIKQFKKTSIDVGGKKVPVTNTNYKLYSNDNSSTGTLGSVELWGTSEKNADVYEGKPYVEVHTMEVKPSARGRNLSKELTRISVHHSRDDGKEGRLSLYSSNLLSKTPATSSPTVIHKKNGFRLWDNKQAQALDTKLKNGQKIEPDSFHGDMYLPEDEIQNYLKRTPLSEKANA